MKNTRAETRQWYDRISRFYDLFSSAWEGPFRRAGLWMLDLHPGESVLEIGPGTGHGLAYLGKAAGPSGLVCGLDLSPAMLEISARRLRTEEVPTRTLMLVGDALRLPLRRKSFDAIFASFVVELFDPQELPVLLSGFGDVLRPGGRLCAVSMSGAGSSVLIRHLYERAQRRFPKLIDCQPIQLASSLEAAGFKLRSVSRRASLDMPVEVVLALKA